MSTSDLFGDGAVVEAAIIAAYEQEYSRLEDSWKAIEAKAQATGAVAGIFTGFALAFAKELSSAAAWYVRGLSVLALLLLLATIITSATAVHIRANKSPPRGAQAEKFARDYQAARNLTDRDESAPLFQQELLILWRDTNADRLKSNEAKASRVAFAQYFLLTAICVTGILATVIALTPRSGNSTGGVTIYEMSGRRVQK